MKTPNKKKTWQVGKKNRNDYLGNSNHVYTTQLAVDIGKPKTDNWKRAAKRGAKRR